MAIRMKTTITFRAGGSGKSHARTDISVRDVQFPIDEPVERGGTNAGPSPTETALASLIGCTHVIGNKCAAKLGLEVGTLSIDDRRGVLLQDEVEIPFPAATLTVRCSAPLSEADLARLAAEVEKYCPISKLFKHAGTNLQTHWVSQ